MKKDRSWTEINLSNFEFNLNELKKFITRDQTIMQIVKADAYGHGAYEISKRAIKCGAQMLGVANAEEGALLRYQGIDLPILILSPSFEHEIAVIIENDLIPTISTLNFARRLNRTALADNKTISVHVEIDTGMGRSGFKLSDAEKAIQEILSLSNVSIQGVFSHYAASENDPEYTAKQYKYFYEFVKKLNFEPEIIHIANSSGVITYLDSFCNMVRLGLLSYGVYSDDSLKAKIELKPVMHFKTRISQIKIAEPGEYIGYNCTFKVKKKMRYAILPVGYADGYDYLLSNRGEVLLHGKLCPVVGKVSMDMITIDISEVTHAEIGDEVVLLGDKLRAEHLTSKYNGLSYELLSQIGRRAKRYYRDDGDIVATSPLLRREFVSSDFSDKKLNRIIEAAIEQRMQSKEIANLIYSDVLERLFAIKDHSLSYRHNFEHVIKFEEDTEIGNFYRATTTLSFEKRLQHEYFIVACAKNEKKLEKYFLRRDVEYRWLLDNNFDLDTKHFSVSSVRINNLELTHSAEIKDGCIEIRCSHPELGKMVGRNVQFSIETKTYYPKSTHQLSIFITDITQSVNIRFEYDDLFEKVEAIPLFAGKSKFPNIEYHEKSVNVESDRDEWIFPSSGVVFVF